MLITATTSNNPKTDWIAISYIGIFSVAVLQEGDRNGQNRRHPAPARPTCIAPLGLCHCLWFRSLRAWADGPAAPPPVAMVLGGEKDAYILPLSAG